MFILPLINESPGSDSEKKRPSTLGGRPDKDHRAEDSYMFPARSKLEIKIAFRKRSNKQVMSCSNVQSVQLIQQLSCNVTQCTDKNCEFLFFSVLSRQSSRNPAVFKLKNCFSC